MLIKEIHYEDISDLPDISEEIHKFRELNISSEINQIIDNFLDCKQPITCADINKIRGELLSDDENNQHLYKLNELISSTRNSVLMGQNFTSTDESMQLIFKLRDLSESAGVQLMHNLYDFLKKFPFMKETEMLYGFRVIAAAFPNEAMGCYYSAKRNNCLSDHLYSALILYFCNDTEKVIKFFNEAVNLGYAGPLTFSKMLEHPRVPLKEKSRIKRIGKKWKIFEELEKMDNYVEALNHPQGIFSEKGIANLRKTAPIHKTN